MQKTGLKGSNLVSGQPSPETNYKCQACHDSGFLHPLLEDGKPDYSRVITCQCQKENLEQQKRDRYLRFCQLPADSERMTFENFACREGLEEALDCAKKVATGELNWLTLMSLPDRGKTHLIIAICRHWLSRGKPARYIYIPLLLNELREGYDTQGRDYANRLDLFLNIPLLVLDDLGVQRPTPWANEQLHMIIDYRYMQGLPLVVTTNKPLGELPGDDEHRIASRLQRAENSRVVVIDAPEHRMVKDDNNHS